MAVDGSSEETRTKVRELLYIVSVDVVPTLVMNNRNYPGMEAFAFFEKYLNRGKPKEPLPPTNIDVNPIGRNVSVRMPVGQEKEQIPLFSRQDTDATSLFARFQEAAQEPVQGKGQDVPEFLKAIDTKESGKGDDLESRLKELNKARAMLDADTKPPV